MPWNGLWPFGCGAQWMAEALASSAVDCLTQPRCRVCLRPVDVCTSVTLRGSGFCAQRVAAVQRLMVPVAQTTGGRQEMVAGVSSGAVEKGCGRAVRVALIHDYLNQYGGAERVLEALHELFPAAPVYTSLYDPAALPAHYRSWDIRTTWIQHLPGAPRRHQPYLAFYPFAFGRLNLRGYDLLLSSSSAFAKGVPKPPEAVHVCYCHSPMRFAWNFQQYAAREQLSPLARRLLPPLMAWLRRWDVQTSRQLDAIVANSHAVAERIHRYWGREATVIFPPVDVERMRPVAPHEVGDYFLVVSRLVPYKRLDLAIAACNALKLPLKIVGDGRDRAALAAQAGPTVEFLGAVSDEQKFALYARCRAALFPAEDDFGIAQVEVQAAGRPAIALARGGALDTVVDGVTGVLFSEQTVESLVAALRRFESLTFSSDVIVAHAQRFSRRRFLAEMRSFIETIVAHRVAQSQATALAR